MMMIDIPAPMAPRETWRAFLAEMEQSDRENPGRPEVAEAIKEAKAALSDRSAGAS